MFVVMVKLYGWKHFRDFIFFVWTKKKKKKEIVGFKVITHRKKRIAASVSKTMLIAKENKGYTPSLYNLFH